MSVCLSVCLSVCMYVFSRTHCNLTLQKVNTSVKKSEQDLDQVNSNIDDIHDATLSFAPSLRMDIYP